MQTAGKMQHTVEQAIEPGLPLVRALFIGAILASIFAAIATTVPMGRSLAWPLVVEAVCGIVFLVEYLLRLWTVSPRADGSRGRETLRLARSPLMLLDLAGLLPGLLLLVAPSQAGLILLLQVARFLRLARYSTGLQAVGMVFVAERGPLAASLVIGGGMLLAAATGMYLLEGEVQPDKLGSIPLAMYWAIITLATVGYGDIYPVTAGGKIFAGAAAVSGIVFFALPVAIIATGFLDQIRRRDFIVSYAMVARVPLFQRLDAAAVVELAGLLKARRIAQDAIILREGDIGDEMFFIASGEVEVVLPDRVIVLRTGDFFGEAAVLGNARRNATVIARTPCEMLGLGAADVLRLAGRQPQVGEALRAAVAARTKG